MLLPCPGIGLVGAPPGPASGSLEVASGGANMVGSPIACANSVKIKDTIPNACLNCV